MASQLGRVVKSEEGLPYRVVFPDSEHPVASSFLRDLAASDCSPATLRSYAYDLLRWFRFLHDRFVQWEKAERLDVRALVEHMKAFPTANAIRRASTPARRPTLSRTSEGPG